MRAVTGPTEDTRSVPDSGTGSLVKAASAGQAPGPFSSVRDTCWPIIACQLRSSNLLELPRRAVERPRPTPGMSPSVPGSDGIDKDLPVLRAVCRPDQPAPLHHLDDAGCAVVAEAQL